MSAFAVIYERSNAPVEPGVLERVMERLRHRGPDGCDAQTEGNVAMGHWHFWTTPEESGEHQPLRLQHLPFTIVLDGRLDNRSELLDRLCLPPVESEQLSDASLILHAYDKWGEDCFKHFTGAFALVIVDTRRGDLVCARDALGDRTLFYSFKGTRLVIASEPWAVAGADDSITGLDERAAAHYFALQTTPDGQTLFKNIQELLPSHAMKVSAAGQRMWRTWQPNLSFRLRGKPDEDYAEEFRSLLEESIRCRLRSNRPVGILMSGGLDSGSVACLAARMLAPRALTTVSYVFNELADCDERQYIRTIEEKWGIHSIQIPGDDAWPYKDWQNWSINPNQPEGNPYHLLINRAYHRASQEGLGVLLTGGFGDHLYDAGEYWLADLIDEGRLMKAVQALSNYIRYAGWRWTLQTGFLQCAARNLLNTLPGGRHLHRRRRSPPCLTSFSSGLLSPPGTETDPAMERHGNLLGRLAANGISSEEYNTIHHRLELRHPYRDRRLVEFVLSLPAYQLYRHGQYKHVLRNAMRDILPEAIRTRWKPTSFLSFYFRGVEQEKTTLQSCFQDRTASWTKFINEDWIEKHWSTPIPPEKDGPEVVVPWLCFSYEMWYKYHTLGWNLKSRSSYGSY